MKTPQPAVSGNVNITFEVQVPPELGTAGLVATLEGRPGVTGIQVVSP